MRLVREMMCIVYCKATKKKRQTQQADNIENCYEMDFQLFAWCCLLARLCPMRLCLLYDCWLVSLYRALDSTTLKQQQQQQQQFLFSLVFLGRRARSRRVLRCALNGTRSAALLFVLALGDIHQFICSCCRISDRGSRQTCNKGITAAACNFCCWQSRCQRRRRSKDQHRHEQAQLCR